MSQQNFFFFLLFSFSGKEDFNEKEMNLLKLSEKTNLHF